VPPIRRRAATVLAVIMLSFIVPPSDALAQWYPRWPFGGFYDRSGSLRLQVTPRDTEVFVNGYYAGIVDDFDGVFQRLHLPPGEYEIQLYLPGHRLGAQKIFIQPTGTFRIRHTMEPLQPGETAAPRPSGGPPPAP
jgi:hypothetical protein